MAPISAVGSSWRAADPAAERGGSIIPTAREGRCSVPRVHPRLLPAMAAASLALALAITLTLPPAAPSEPDRVVVLETTPRGAGDR
jgi:hypothetical protein